MIWTIIWAVIAAVALIIELSSAALLSIWFVIGAAVSFVLSLLSVPVWIQIVSFIVISSLLFFFAYKRIIKVKPPATNTNLFIGKRCNVIETIDFSKNKGKVKINDQYWLAIPENKEEILERNTIVKIVNVENTTLVVVKE